MHGLRGIGVVILGWVATVMVSGGAIGQPVSAPDSEIAALKLMLAKNPADAELRDVLDDVWAKYRELQDRNAVDGELRSKLVTFVKDAFARLGAINPTKVKRPWDNKKSAKWNRENQQRPVRRYDGEKVDERTGNTYVNDCFTGTTYEKPHQLIAIGSTQAKFQVLTQESFQILLVTPTFGGGKTYALELPAKTEWDYRVTEIRYLAEVQRGSINVAGYTSDVILRPLIIEGVFWIKNSGHRPVDVEQITTFR